MTEQHEHAYQRIGIHSGERDGREFVVEVLVCAVCKDRVEAEITRQTRSEDERTNACQDISCDQPLTSDGKGGCIGYGENVLRPVIPTAGGQERLAL